MTMDYVKTTVLNEEVKQCTQQASYLQSKVLVIENRGEVETKITIRKQYFTDGKKLFVGKLLTNIPSAK